MKVHTYKVDMDTTHTANAENLVESLLAAGVDHQEIFMTTLAMLRDLSLRCRRPGEMYENAIVALAQLVPVEARGIITRAVLEVLADVMEGAPKK